MKSQILERRQVARMLASAARTRWAGKRHSTSISGPFVATEINGGKYRNHTSVRLLPCARPDQSRTKVTLLGYNSDAGDKVQTKGLSDFWARSSLTRSA